MIKPDTQALADDFLSIYEAGENIAEGDALALVKSGTLQHVEIANQSASASNSGLWIAQSFKTSPETTKIAGYSITIQHVTQQTTYTLRLRSSLTGADLHYTTLLEPYNGPYEISVNSGNINVDVSPDTTYYIILSGGGNAFGSATSTYADGQAYQSSNSGGTWSNHGTLADLKVWFRELRYTDLFGKVVKASAVSLENQRFNFIGLSVDTVTAGNPCRVNTNNKLYKTGLTAGQTYYLSDTNGAISTTPGTIKRFVGYAESTSYLNREVFCRRKVTESITSPNIYWPRYYVPASCMFSFTTASGSWGVSVNDIGLFSSSNPDDGGTAIILEAGDILSVSDRVTNRVLTFLQ